MKLDPIDQKIVAALQRDGRMTKLKLAETVALSPAACWERLRRMEEAGVIKGYTAIVDLEPDTPRTTVIVEISLKSQRGLEFGFWGASHTNSNFVGSRQYQTVDQYCGFFRYHFRDAGELRFWGGGTNDNEGIFGADAYVPFSNRFSLQTGFNYLIPEKVMTPDTVETRLGKLQFFDGMPDAATTEMLYDNLDLMRGVETFLNGIPATSVEALRQAHVEQGLRLVEHEPPIAIGARHQRVPSGVGQRQRLSNQCFGAPQQLA